MVTHDRYFLDSVTERIVEIDRGAICSFPGNYEAYLEQKAQMEEMAEASLDPQKGTGLDAAGSQGAFHQAESQDSEI